MMDHTTGEIPLPFSRSTVCEFFKVPCIRLVKVERLGQPTQGWRVGQTGTKPFSLTAPGSDPSWELNPGRIGQRLTC